VFAIRTFSHREGLGLTHLVRTSRSYDLGMDGRPVRLCRRTVLS